MQIMCLMKCFTELSMSCDVISERIFIWNNDVVMMENDEDGILSVAHDIDGIIKGEMLIWFLWVTVCFVF